MGCLRTPEDRRSVGGDGANGLPSLLRIAGERHTGSQGTPHGAPVTYRCCPSCAVGLMTYDPSSGEWTCGACDARTMLPPLFAGGQGREAEDVSETGSGLAVAVAVGAILGVLMIAGFMLAGG